jgi:DNA-directed RNA polymerase subunit RPC12/RpoP
MEVNMYCTSCGKQIPDNSQFCLSCGAPIIIPPTNADAISNTIQIGTRCPTCGRDDAIQKISAILTGGKASGTYSGPSGGVAYVGGKWGAVSGYSTLHGSSMTDLARLLTPPHEPESRAFGCFSSSLIWFFFGLLALGGCGNSIGIIVGLEKNQTVYALISDLALGIVGILVLVWYIRKSISVRAKYPTRKAAWDAAMIRWNRLYYCNRDDIVFDPQTRETCKLREMERFIYQQT